MKNSDDFLVKVWAQMFFEDGSVSQGKRYPAEVLDNELGELRQIAVHLLQSVNREKGFLLIWGAGNIFYRHYDFGSIFPEKQDESSESATSQP